MIDSVDKLIIDRLRVNCRIGFQELASLSGISANEVMKRVDRFVTSGIIEKFVVILSPQITNEDRVIAILEFATDQIEDRLLEHLRGNQSVHKVSRLLDGRYIVFGVYFDQEELSAFTMHLGRLPNIKEVELHSRFLNYWGGKIDLQSSHRKILRCLLDDPLKSVSNIAKETGFESNDIKRIIEQMTASETVLFTIRTSDDMKEGSMEVLAKIQWNVGETNKEIVLEWLQEEFASLRLGECVSAREPTLFFHFSVNHVEEVDAVIRKAKESGLITTIEPFVLFPGMTFPDPRQKRARALLEETGFSSQNELFLGRRS